MADGELAKDLGLLSALTIGIGTMIGAGIFVLPGVAAQETGPVVVVSFVVGGLIAMVNALSVSELGTAMPKAGGGYYYVNRALGPLFGSIAGLGDWVGLAFASAFYAIGFGQYLATLVALPDLLFLSDVQIGAIVAGAVFVGINYVGAKETGGVQTVIVLVLLAILGAFALAGWFAFDWGTLTGSGGLAPFGYGELLPGTALVFVSYLGYAKIATVAEELKDPGRNLPIAIVGSVAFVTVVYTVLVTVMLGVVPWPDLDLAAPVANAATVAFPASIALPIVGEVGGIATAAATVMTIGALLATASSANASILASARINFAMGREKIVTDWLNEIHPEFATPYRSILVTGGVIVAFIAVLGSDVAVLAKAASVLHLVVYALMNVGLIVFRETGVEYDPAFEVPLYPATPILGAVLSVGLIGFMAPIEIALAGTFVAGAVLWYFLYARGEATDEGHLGRYVRDRADVFPEPAVAAAETVRPDGGTYRVLVPLSNPRTERDLIELAAEMAASKGGVVDAVHVVTVPDQTPLYAGARHVEEIDAASKRLLDAARTNAETFGVDIETHTIVSHRSVEEVFDAASDLRADLVVMGWSTQPFWSAGRVESTFDELAGTLPCDFLVLRDRGFDPERVLVPIAGGTDSDLSATVARVLRDRRDANIELLHIVESVDERAAGTAFLGEWATERGLGDAELTVDVSDDVETAIVDCGHDATLVVLGATEQGLLARLLGGSLVADVAERLECSVVLCERPRPRSLRERLFGSIRTARAHAGSRHGTEDVPESADGAREEA